ncbi:exosome catalytic subunit dis3 [Pleurotus pulmonarius]|nr:exosome catalytic subunit dis3 [Pleurotus pulmonarius]
MPEITIRKRPQAEAVITQGKFFRKSARGKVIKVLRERYLRTDVSCGVQYCSSCSQLDNFSEGPFKSPSEELPQFGDKYHISFPDGHFVLPDTNVFLAQMDLLESSLFRAPIIVLQTVMEENSTPITPSVQSAQDADSCRHEGKAVREIQRTEAEAARKEVYDDHLPVSVLLAGIKAKMLQQGHFTANQYNYLEKLLVAIDTWPANKHNPEGHLVRRLDAVGDKDTEQESLMLEFGVVYAPFGKRVMECLPEDDDKWVVPPKPRPDQGDVDVKAKTVWKDREDLRDMIICSIDPPGTAPPTTATLRDLMYSLGCQDIDEALHARHLPNGNIEAGVRTYFLFSLVAATLTPEQTLRMYQTSPMDTEAVSRGTTVYLVDKRVDMLPALLGTNLRSLHPHVERLAFPAIWELTPDADIVTVRFTKSDIASKAAFTYEEARVRKGPHLLDELTTGIRLLNSLAIKLKAKRMAADVLAYRQLVAAIDYTTLHPSLHSAQNVDRILDVVNRRHRMAQMASHASVEFYVGFALKQRGEAENEAGVQEEAFVIRTFRNGVGVFVNKFGITGVVMFKRDATEFDADNYTISIPNSKGTGNVDRGVFDKVTVRIEVEKDKNTQ